MLYDDALQIVKITEQIKKYEYMVGVIDDFAGLSELSYDAQVTIRKTSAIAGCGMSRCFDIGSAELSVLADYCEARILELKGKLERNYKLEKVNDDGV